MTTLAWTDAETSKAVGVWAEYQKRHDTSGLVGQTAGIDPSTGRIWFGESAADIWQQMELEGLDKPLYYVRVGSDYYVRKGGRR